MKTRINRESSFLFLIPAAIFVLLAELVPVAYTTYLGFMEWDVINPPKWVGLSNYLKVFSTPELLNALKNTGFWVAGTLIFAVGLALLVAVLMSRIEVRGGIQVDILHPLNTLANGSRHFLEKSIGQSAGCIDFNPRSSWNSCRALAHQP
jgi:ABC-type sugar transport system permease subunit